MEGELVALPIVQGQQTIDFFLKEKKWNMQKKIQKRNKSKASGYIIRFVEFSREVMKKML